MENTFKIKLYHGSGVVIEEPIIIPVNPKRTLDYGAGFYAPANQEQADEFTNRARFMNGPRITNIYEFDATQFSKLGLKTMTFEEPDELWLDFVIENRRNATIHNEVDLIIGPVADDNVYSTIQLFESGILTATEAIARFEKYTLTDQLCFTTDKALSCLTFLKSYEVTQ
jgi:hypothetical protein